VKCPHCDSELTPGARFCDACGMAVEDAAASPTPQPFIPPPPPVIPEAYVPYPAPIITDQTIPSPVQDATIPRPPDPALEPMTFASPAPEPDPAPTPPAFFPTPDASPDPEPAAPPPPEPFSFPGPAAVEQPQPVPTPSGPPPASHPQQIGYGPTVTTIQDPSGTVLGMTPSQAGTITLVLGITGLALSCVGCGGILGLAGVILGFLGLNKVPGSRGKIGLVLSGLSIIVALVVVCLGGFLMTQAQTSSGSY
jgi:hypothetical protein